MGCKTFDALNSEKSDKMSIMGCSKKTWITDSNIQNKLYCLEMIYSFFNGSGVHRQIKNVDRWLQVGKSVHHFDLFGK